MSGHCSGVQHHIKAVAPMAVYVHCYAHCVNLVLVDSTKSVAEASEFFALLCVYINQQSTYNLYSAAVRFTSWKANSSITTTLRYSLACRFYAVDAVCSTFDAILGSLQSIMDGRDKGKATEACGIYMQIHSFKFLTTLILFW